MLVFVKRVHETEYSANADFIFLLQFAEGKDKFWKFAASFSPDSQGSVYNLIKAATILLVLMGREGPLSVGVT